MLSKIINGLEFSAEQFRDSFDVYVCRVDDPDRDFLWIGAFDNKHDVDKFFAALPNKKRADLPTSP